MPCGCWPILPRAMLIIHSPSPRCCSSGRHSPARRVFQHCYVFLQSTLVARAKLARIPWARCKLLFYLGRDPTCVAVANTTSLFFGTVQQTYQLGYFQTAPLCDPGSHTNPHFNWRKAMAIISLSFLVSPAQFASEQSQTASKWLFFWQEMKGERIHASGIVSSRLLFFLSRTIHIRKEFVTA